MPEGLDTCQNMRKLHLRLFVVHRLCLQFQISLVWNSDGAGRQPEIISSKDSRYFQLCTRRIQLQSKPIWNFPYCSQTKDNANISTAQKASWIWVLCESAICDPETLLAKRSFDVSRVTFSLDFRLSEGIFFRRLVSACKDITNYVWFK